jgi:hypothetical protein
MGLGRISFYEGSDSRKLYNESRVFFEKKSKFHFEKNKKSKCLYLEMEKSKIRSHTIEKSKPHAR